MSLSSLNSIGQTVFELESRNANVDGQTEGHINLMGGLVTHNLPKNIQIHRLLSHYKSIIYSEFVIHEDWIC